MPDTTPWVSSRLAIRKILIANRGEIAVRIIRTAREMGIAMRRRLLRRRSRRAPRRACRRIVPARSGGSPRRAISMPKSCVDCAQRAGADAVHPGYGFLAENAEFARRVVAAGLTWIGPHAEAIDAMGDKLRARRAMQAAGVPFVPGATQPIARRRRTRATPPRSYGLPLALKAAAGGGGKGLRVARSLRRDRLGVRNGAARSRCLLQETARSTPSDTSRIPSTSSCRSFADKHGNVVHVGERDCSLQRRHQKLWEETPAAISPHVRAAMREAGHARRAAIGYDSTGTIECLVAGDAFYFLEMNTRIQVEHTVTEMVTGLDLVREQIRLAAGEPLGYAQDDIEFRGYAIEARVNAEDPAQNFRPAPGTITAYREPAGPGVRVDSAAYAGWTIPAEYDSLVAKLDRLGALARSRDRAAATRHRRVSHRGCPDHAAVSYARSAIIPPSSTARTARRPSRPLRRLAPAGRSRAAAAALPGFRHGSGRWAPDRATPRLAPKRRLEREWK